MDEVRRGSLTRARIPRLLGRSAEAARDKAEVARRSADKRAKSAEEELGAVKDKLDAKSKQVRAGEVRVPPSPSFLLQCTAAAALELVLHCPRKAVMVNGCGVCWCVPQAAELETAVAAAQSALERQRKGHEEALAALEAQHKLQSRKIATDADTEKKNAQVRGQAGSGQGSCSEGRGSSWCRGDADALLECTDTPEHCCPVNARV